jgi:hypothetical protein
MKHFCIISFLVTGMIFSQCSTGAQKTEGSEFEACFMSLIDSVEAKVLEHGHSGGIIELNVKELGWRIDCLSQITGTKSSITMGYFFGYESFEDFSRDKAQWNQWFRDYSEAPVKGEVKNSDCCIQKESKSNEINLVALSL